jgi:hypothetical protein
MDLERATLSKVVNLTTKIKEQNSSLDTAISALKHLRVLPRFEGKMEKREGTKVVGLTAEKEAKLRDIINFLDEMKINEYDMLEVITNTLTDQPA